MFGSSLTPFVLCGLIFYLWSLYLFTCPYHIILMRLSLKRRVSLVRLTRPEHMSSRRILVGFLLFNLYISAYFLYIILCPFCPLSLGHCTVCPSSIYGYWLPLWYLQVFLVYIDRIILSPRCYKLVNLYINIRWRIM